MRSRSLPTQRFLGVLATLFLSGCGLDDLGVLSVSFDLRPTGASQLAEIGVTAGPTIVFELMSASGHVTVNPRTNQGLVTARDLPAYAQRTYLVRLDAANDDRSGLPTAPAVRLEPHIFPMTEDAVGSGRWRLSFDTVPGHEIGAVRSCTIYLVLTETASIADGGHHVVKGTPVLTGAASDVAGAAGTTGSSSGGGHVHGV